MKRRTEKSRYSLVPLFTALVELLTVIASHFLR